MKEYVGDDDGAEPWKGYKSNLNVLTSNRFDGYCQDSPLASYTNPAPEGFWDSTITGENQLLE